MKQVAGRSFIPQF